jgi:DNA invertase Pin-like site-specific DNA recombinase
MGEIHKVVRNKEEEKKPNLAKEQRKEIREHFKTGIFDKKQLEIKYNTSRRTISRILSENI